MRLSDRNLDECIAAWRAIADVETRSELDNVWFEERVNAARQQAFENIIGVVAGWNEFYRRHVDYHRTFVQVGEGFLPHTFLPDFVLRNLTGIDDKQVIVRVESLARPLSAIGLSFADLQRAFATSQHDVLDHFVRSWNESSVRDARPAFATPKSAVIEDLEREDWPERLRDRLGLAHYDAAAGPEPVALMEYRVEEILAAARGAGTPCALTAPTVLDTGPWRWFFPAPTELDCGRAMALFEIASDADLVVELLHVRLTYKRQHIAQLGEIRRPPAPVALASGRDDFGEEIPDHALGGT